MEKQSSLKLYSYCGPVYSFGRLIHRKFEAHTMAVSKKRAKANFIYQYKQRYNLVPGSSVQIEEKYIVNLS